MNSISVKQICAAIKRQQRRAHGNETRRRNAQLREEVEDFEDAAADYERASAVADCGLAQED